MAVLHVSEIASGRKHLDYLDVQDKQRGHDNSAKRNMKIITKNILPGVNPLDVFQERWDKQRSKYEVMGYMVSFDELDPNNPADVEKASQICYDFCDTEFPNEPCVICLQSDGKGGMLHAHIDKPYCGEDGKVQVKSATGGNLRKQKGPNGMAHRFNNVARKYIDLSLEFSDNGDVIRKNKAPAKENIVTQKEDGIGTRGKYVFRDDLKSRIEEVRGRCRDAHEFLDRLEEVGLSYRWAYPKDKDPYLIYEMADWQYDRYGVPLDIEGSIKHKDVKATKLGEGYTLKGLFGSDWTPPRKNKEVESPTMSNDRSDDESRGHVSSSKKAESQQSSVSSSEREMREPTTKSRELFQSYLSETWHAEMMRSIQDETTENEEDEETQQIKTIIEKQKDEVERRISRRRGAKQFADVDMAVAATHKGRKLPKGGMFAEPEKQEADENYGY